MDTDFYFKALLIIGASALALTVLIILITSVWSYFTSTFKLYVLVRTNRPNAKITSGISKICQNYSGAMVVQYGIIKDNNSPYNDCLRIIVKCKTHHLDMMRKAISSYLTEDIQFFSWQFIN